MMGMVVLKMIIPGLNELLYKLEFQSEQYCIEEDTVKDMHLPLNIIHDTTQLNL